MARYEPVAAHKALSQDALSQDALASVDLAPDGLFGKEGVTFHDVLEMFNPLQHLPIIGNIYREITGDDMKPGVRLIGGVLFGGPTGLVGAAINTVVEYN